VCPPASCHIAYYRFFAQPVLLYSLYALYHKRGLMARAFLFLNDPVQSLAHAHVGSNPILGDHCPYSIPVFITYMLYAPYHKCSSMARAFLFLSD
jgi:hypothetical protein